MIERCDYCQKEHETDEMKGFGMSLKSCPEHPLNPMFTMMDGKNFVRFIDTEADFPEESPVFENLILP